MRIRKGHIVFLTVITAITSIPLSALLRSSVLLLALAAGWDLGGDFGGNLSGDLSGDLGRRRQGRERAVQRRKGRCRSRAESSVQERNSY